MSDHSTKENRWTNHCLLSELTGLEGTPTIEHDMNNAVTTDAIRRAEDLEETAALALEFGKLLMQAGSSGRHVENTTAKVAAGLGAEGAEVCIDYSSITLTIRLGPRTVTGMCKVGALSVNETLYRALSRAALRIEQQDLTVAQARTELETALRDTHRHPDWLVAIAVGVGCAAFGRLMGVDWLGLGPIFLGAAVGQLGRRQLSLWNVNVFLSAAAVAFLGASLCGFVSRWSGSQTVDTNMIATVLLLVPGVPTFNAEYEILQGRPALGSARAIWAMAMLVFMTAGIWLAQSLFGATP